MHYRELALRQQVQRFPEVSRSRFTQPRLMKNIFLLPSPYCAAAVHDPNRKLWGHLMVKGHAIRCQEDCEGVGERHEAYVSEF